MKWITNKVIPLVAYKYPGVQMVPVMDNAPYHHVRGIPYLKSFSSKRNVNPWRITASTVCSFRWPMSKSLSYPSSTIAPSTTGNFELLLTKKNERKEKPNQTLSKIHQTKNSRLPPSFGWSATSPKSFAARWRTQSSILAVRYSGRHPTARTSSQLSCIGRQEREMFPVTNTSNAVSNPQFPTWGTAVMVTLITLPVGKWICVSLRTKIPIF